jgi:iron(III) transport system ATP-binding protein
MAEVTLTGLRKSFGVVEVLKGIDLRIEDGDFAVILGPSGCGKTTLLRSIAGFERLSAGSIAVGDRLLSGPDLHVPPEERRMGIVFQSYALWPHMTVAGNVAYALKVEGVPRAERDARVAAALRTVGLDGFAERRPASLSGGQRQRVALARCLAMRPALVLLDEPLANLDPHLRAAMQQEFAAFRREARTTMLYITHDQAEAMALADRIAVMDAGRLLQAAPPATLYREPADATVARFVGEGLVLSAVSRGAAGPGRCMVEILGTSTEARCASAPAPGARVAVCLRPGNAMLARDGLPARIVNLTYRGGGYRAEAAAEGAPGIRFALDLPEPTPVAEGAAVRIAFQDGWVLPMADAGAIASATATA